MAAAAARNFCRFQWEIKNPFVPWRQLTATFYHGSPTVKQWKVILRPMNRSICTWDFRFSLHCVVLDHEESVFTEKVEVCIWLNERETTRNEEENYSFSRGNYHRKCFDVTVNANPREEPHELTIEVLIYFPSESILNRDGSGLFYEKIDLIRLSQDLRRLLDEPFFCNMRLLSKDRTRTFRVHSCIIRGRWDNFFREHTFQDEIQTDISLVLLQDILIYIYSGVLVINWPTWVNVDNATELFQVIDSYKLYHLYKVFVRDDSQQKRITRRQVIISIHRLPLQGVDERLLNNPSYTLNVNPAPSYELTFNIQFFLRARSPWFLYRLESKCPFKLEVQVNLEFLQKFMIRPRTGSEMFRLRFQSVHDRDYKIDPTESVQSGTCHLTDSTFLHLNEFLSNSNGIRTDRSVRHFMRCTFSLADRSSVLQVTNMHNAEIQTDLERFEVLSDHMHLIKQQKQPESDLTVVCPIELSNPEKMEYAHHLHKSIFAARVRGWRAVLGNVPEGVDLPERVRSTLRSDAFQSVLDYIYTGKVNRIPIAFLDEIDRFAEEGRSELLQNLVHRMRKTNQSRSFTKFSI